MCALIIQNAVSSKIFPLFQIIWRFGFSRYTNYFIMYLDIVYI